MSDAEPFSLHLAELAIARFNDARESALSVASHLPAALVEVRTLRKQLESARRERDACLLLVSAALGNTMACWALDTTPENARAECVKILHKTQEQLK